MVEKFATGISDTGVVDTGGKIAAGVVDAGGKFATGVVGTGGAPWLANISEKIRNSLNGILWGWGEKNQKQKISWHYPFN